MCIHIFPSSWNFLLLRGVVWKIGIDTYKISFSHRFMPYIQSTTKSSQLYYHLLPSPHAQSQPLPGREILNEKLSNKQSQWTRSVSTVKQPQKFKRGERRSRPTTRTIKHQPNLNLVPRKRGSNQKRTVPEYLKKILNSVLIEFITSLINSVLMRLKLLNSARPLQLHYFSDSILSFLGSKLPILPNINIFALLLSV